MSLPHEQKNTRTVFQDLTQNGPIPGDQKVLDEVLYDGIDIDNPVDNVIGIVFNTKEDEHAFFDSFDEEFIDGEFKKMQGTPLMIEKEVGSGEFEEMFVFYSCASDKENIPNDVIAFVGNKYSEECLNMKWVKSLLYQGKSDVTGNTFMLRFLKALMKA